MERFVNKKGVETKIFAKTIEDAALSQIEDLCNSDAYAYNKIRIMPDCHAGKGCTIGTTMVLTDKVTPNLVGVDISCIDCDTEILTPEGWKRISEYDGEEIMQFNPENNQGTFKEPLLFIKKPCDTFYHFKNSKGLDQMVSDEHNMLVYYGKKELKFYKKKPSYFNNVKSIEKGYYRFNTCFNIEKQGINLSDDLIRIDIMVQADGRIRKYDDYNFVELHFRKERKIKRAISLLEKANIKYNLSIWKDGTTNISFHITKEIDKTLNKYWHANHFQLEIITRECLLWDGHTGYRSFYSSTIKENADVIQYAFIATNTRASIYTNINDTHNRKNSYCVIPTKNKYVGYNKKPSIEKSKDGFKYCFTTKDGYFLCRRNNYTFITGNCGMLVCKISEKDIDLIKLDEIINKYVPCGFNIHDKPLTTFDLSGLNCYGSIDSDVANRSIGSLGSGNHFIEIDKDIFGNNYLVIHSGSRNLGVRVCKYYQDLAVSNLLDNKSLIKETVSKLKREGRSTEITEELSKIRNNKPDKNLAYLEGINFRNYIHDMKIIQEYAHENRKMISDIIRNHMNFTYIDCFETLHNYIDVDKMILRKGAVSAQLGERLIIPMNMRDGSLICTGKGNEDWNYSAPHGAGRLMSRKKAKETLSMDDFKNEMNGITSTSICESTLDESPMAYKPMDEIIDCIKDTVYINRIIKPIYNFKAK